MELFSNADLPPKETGDPPAILHVEDDEGLRLLIQKKIKREGFSSHGVSKGAEAIAWLASHECVLLLLDYRLPDMTGEEVIRSLQKRGLNIPFIICTGLGDENAEENMLRLGARDYLVKGRAFFDRLNLAVKAAVEHFPVKCISADGPTSLRDPK